MNVDVGTESPVTRDTPLNTYVFIPFDAGGLS